MVWTYDNAGNILTRAEYAYTTESLEGVTPTDTVNYTYGDEDWGDLLTAYDGVAISYDEIGNPLSDGAWTYTWEHGRELASMTDGTTTWTYTYNADGLRTQRTNGTNTYKYIYNGSSLVQMTVGNDTLYFTDATVTYNGTVYYYVKNLQGDVIAILDSAGVAVVEYSYDAWGNILSMSDTSNVNLGTLNPLRYRGYVYDSETGLYYLQSRYYDPEIGRFINADALVATGQGLLGNNMFAYCLNSPINFSDPAGERAKLWPILFGDHVPGFIHKTVQAHIIVTGLFEDELYLPGAGFADIYDPDTGEIWEIKHGGSTVDMQLSRISCAENQIARYVNNPTKIPLTIGHAGAFTGMFVINCDKISYCVTYDTPEPGVILYYVQEMAVYEPAASYAYYPKKEESAMYMMGLMLVPVPTGGGSTSLDPILQKSVGLS